MLSSTDRHSGVPGAMAWVSHRLAGSGSPTSIAASNVSGVGSAAASRSHSCRTGRACRGAVEVTFGPPVGGPPALSPPTTGF